LPDFLNQPWYTFQSNLPAIISTFLLEDHRFEGFPRNNTVVRGLLRVFLPINISNLTVYITKHIQESRSEEA
jgi:hypothetical protein